MKEKGEKLSRRFTFRANDFEGEQLMILASQANMSVNSYLRGLVMNEYRKYREQKISDAIEKYWN